MLQHISKELEDALKIHLLQCHHFRSYTNLDDYDLIVASSAKLEVGDIYTSMESVFSFDPIFYAKVNDDRQYDNLVCLIIRKKRATNTLNVRLINGSIIFGGPSNTATHTLIVTETGSGDLTAHLTKKK